MPDLTAMPAGVGGHVRAALVDDADDPERHADPRDLEAVGPRPFGQHAADRVGQVGDVLEPLSRPLRAASGRAPAGRAARAPMPARCAAARSSALAARIALACARTAAAAARSAAALASAGGQRQRRRGLARAPPDRGHRRGEIGALRLRSRISVSVRHRRSVTTRSSRWMISSRPR